MGENNTFIVDEQIYDVKNYFKEHTIKFQLYKNCIISNCIRGGYRWEEYQHYLASKYINSDSIVVEIGAHIGSLTMVYSKLAKTVYAFEPTKESFDLLNKNISLNECKNVISKQVGVGDKIESTKIGWIGNNNSGATILEGGIVTNKVLDSAKGGSTNNIETKIDLINLDVLTLDRLDYLKIDVEGYEEKVIKGGLNTIRKFKPIIVMECMDDYSKQKPISKVNLESKYKSLLDLGYTYKILGKGNIDKNWDVLFKPKKFIAQMELKKVKKEQARLKAEERKLIAIIRNEKKYSNKIVKIK